VLKARLFQQPGFVLHDTIETRMDADQRGSDLPQRLPDHVFQPAPNRVHGRIPHLRLSAFIRGFKSIAKKIDGCEISRRSGRSSHAQPMVNADLL
jgi:hypothetical protein